MSRIFNAIESASFWRFFMKIANFRSCDEFLFQFLAFVCATTRTPVNKSGTQKKVLFKNEFWFWRLHLVEDGFLDAIPSTQFGHRRKVTCTSQNTHAAAKKTRRLDQSFNLCCAVVSFFHSPLILFLLYSQHGRHENIKTTEMIITQVVNRSCRQVLLWELLADHFFSDFSSAVMNFETLFCINYTVKFDHQKATEIGEMVARPAMIFCGQRVVGTRFCGKAPPIPTCWDRPETCVPHRSAGVDLWFVSLKNWFQWTKDQRGRVWGNLSKDFFSKELAWFFKNKNTSHSAGSYTDYFEIFLRSFHSERKSHASKEIRLCIHRTGSNVVGIVFCKADHIGSNLQSKLIPFQQTVFPYFVCKRDVCWAQGRCDGDIRIRTIGEKIELVIPVNRACGRPYLSVWPQRSVWWKGFN